MKYLQSTARRGASDVRCPIHIVALASKQFHRLWLHNRAQYRTNIGQLGKRLAPAAPTRSELYFILSEISRRYFLPDVRIIRKRRERAKKRTRQCRVRRCSSWLVQFQSHAPQKREREKSGVGSKHGSAFPMHRETEPAEYLRRAEQFDISREALFTRTPPNPPPPRPSRTASYHLALVLPRNT